MNRRHDVFPADAERFACTDRSELPRITRPIWANQDGGGACTNFLRVNYGCSPPAVLKGGTDEEILNGAIATDAGSTNGEPFGVEWFCLPSSAGRFCLAAPGRGEAKMRHS